MVRPALARSRDNFAAAISKIASRSSAVSGKRASTPATRIRRKIAYL